MPPAPFFQSDSDELRDDPPLVGTFTVAETNRVSGFGIEMIDSHLTKLIIGQRHMCQAFGTKAYPYAPGAKAEKRFNISGLRFNNRLETGFHHHVSADLTGDVMRTSQNKRIKAEFRQIVYIEAIPGFALWQQLGRHQHDDFFFVEVAYLHTGKGFREAGDSQIDILVDQAFIKEDKISVKQYTAQVAKELGSTIQITGFARYECGEGIEKRKEDFADEIKKLVK